MPYTVRIRHNESGEIRHAVLNLNWGDHSLYWWTDGNFGCDCNRALEFKRAGDATEEEILNDNTPCGESIYTVIDAVLEDGTVIKIDA